MNFVKHHAVLIALGAVVALLSYVLVAVMAPHDVTVDYGLGILTALVAISVVWDMTFNGRHRP